MTLSSVIKAHEVDLGDGFQVRRLLPSARQPSIGPFVFFDHFGPVIQGAGAAADVRPHPHIGLATVTYLFDGAILHRDSLGTVQRIEPGALNWMNAGRGIVHSERAPPDLVSRVRTLHGLQLWCALPQHSEESEPGFVHVPAAAIPECRVDDASVRVLIGAAWGRDSPLRPASPTLYLALSLPPGGRMQLPLLAEQQAVYPLEQAIEVDGERLAAHSLGVLAGASLLTNPGETAADLVVIGGRALDGPRYLWWNFVSSDRERIIRAAEDWAERRFPPVPGDDERIELPDRPLPTRPLGPGR